jgi:membrane protein involved in colicin uptake
MKKWILVICPAVMLGVFLVFYTADRKRALEREAEHKAASEAKIAEKKRNDDAIREKNRKEQAEKEAKKLAEEREKEAKKLADAAKEKQDDIDATNVAKANFQTRSNEIKTIDAQIAAAQKQRDDLLKDILALTTDMAKARIDRTTAELDTDRTRKRLLDLLAADPDMQMPAPGAGGPGAPGGGGRGRGGPGGPGGGPGGGGRG